MQQKLTLYKVQDNSLLQRQLLHQPLKIQLMPKERQGATENNYEVRKIVILSSLGNNQISKLVL